jgi:Flp pilus assembly pilin Flp
MKGAGTMWHKKVVSQKGQNLIEYAIVVAAIASAMVAMSTYVFRSIQATQQVIQEGYAD